MGDDETPSFAPLKNWISTQWRLKGNLRLSMLGGFLILLQFELKEDVDKALRDNVDFYRGKPFFLDRWNPFVGCFREGVQANKAWVRILGLPLFLWDKSFFKQVGDACDGFLGVDEETFEGKNF